MKKMFSILLALAMIFSSFVAFAEETTAISSQFSDIVVGSKIDESVTKLVAHGIISGYPDGTFKPNGEITRAEFAAVITRFSKIGDSLGADAVTGFADLDNDTQNAWARPYVKAAADAGIINGFDDGTFRASQPVTYEQAIKMIICAAGYEVVAKSELSKLQATNAANVTWSSGFIAVANKFGVTAGAITAQITQPASRGTVAILTSNALELDELKANEDGSYEKVEDDDNDTIKEIKGVVSETYYTGLEEANANPGLGKNQISIGFDTDKETYELSDELVSKIDLEDYIGKNVVAYYDKHEYKITSISQKNNQITVIDEATISDITGSTIRYREDSQTRKDVSLDDYIIVYNGKLAEINPVVDTSDEIAQIDLENEFKSGKIELISAAGKNIAKITSYNVLVVDRKSTDSTGDKITFKYGGNGGQAYVVPARQADKPEIYQNKTKKEYNLNLFSEWAVVNHLTSPADTNGNKINRMYITTGAKSGRVTSLTADTRKVQFDGKDYSLAKTYLEYPSRVVFKTNDSYTFYLDCLGHIAAVNERSVSATPYSYGYILDADSKEVSLIKNDGSHAIVPMKDKVKFDGENIDKSEVHTKLLTSAAVYDGAGGDLVGNAQPVKYLITNNDGKDTLVGIDTVADKTGAQPTSLGNDGEDEMFFNAGGTYTPDKQKVTIGTTVYQFSNSTLVMYVPANRDETTKYSVMKASSAFAVSTSRNIEVIGGDPTKTIRNAEMVIIYGVDPAYNLTGKSPYMIVVEKRSEDDKVILDGYKSSDLKKVDPLVISEDIVASSSISTGSVTDAAVDEGDVIRYITNNKGEAIVLEKIYDASANSGGLFTHQSGDDKTFIRESAGGHLSIRYVETIQINKDDEQKPVSINVTTKVGEVSQEDKMNNLFTYKFSSSTPIYRVNEGVLEQGDFSSYIIEADPNSTQIVPSKLIIITNSYDSDLTAKAIYLID